MIQSVTLRTPVGSIFGILGVAALVGGSLAVNDGLFGGLFVDRAEFNIGVVVATVGFAMSAIAIGLLAARRQLLTWSCLAALTTTCAAFGFVEARRNAEREEWWCTTTEDGNLVMCRPIEKSEPEIIRELGKSEVVLNDDGKWLIMPASGKRSPRWYETAASVYVSTDEGPEKISVPYKFVGPNAGS